MIIYSALIFVTTLPSFSIKMAKGIRLNGKEEALWYSADSVYVMRMSEPYYGEEATYSAKVKALQDENNLYFLFKIEYDTIKPDTRLSGRPDWVTVYIDPLHSMIEAYWFSVSLANERNDGLITGDGERFDDTWDGVWESRVRVFQKGKNYLALVELKIPFKTLKFKKKITTWGVNFKVYYENIREEDWWVLPPENTGIKVSMFGLMKNVHPGESGIGLELYPVFLSKKVYSTYLGLNKYNLKAGLDMKYKKGAFSISSTLFPDFAEIESDPFTMTLGRTEIYYEEKRPFFLEGKEIFAPSMNYLNPAYVFYSRRIGKKITDVAGQVPLVFGIKATNKGEKAQLGVLGVLTGRLEGRYDTAHYTFWSALGARHTVFSNSEVGMVVAYRQDLENDSTFYAVSFDGTARKKRNSFSWQVILHKNDSGLPALALQVGGVQFIKRWYLVGFGGNIVSSRFDISPTGYTTLYRGEKGGALLLGKYKIGKPGSFLSSYNANISPIFHRDPEDPGISYGVRTNLSLNFRKPLMMGVYLNGAVDKEYTKDTLMQPYFAKFAGLYMWMRIKSGSLHFSTNWAYTWNYLRMYRGRSIYTTLGVHFPLFAKLGGKYTVKAWSEYRPDGGYRSTTFSGVAGLTYHFTPFMKVTIQNNHVIVHEAVLEPTFSRLSVYYSWEIKPKSRFYLVLNRLFVKNSSRWQSPEFVYAFKVRYLFLF